MKPLKASVESLNRRRFLTTLSATAVAATAFPTGVRAAGKEAPLKVGLIGCGGRGTGATAQALTADGMTTLHALGDIDPDKIELSLKSIAKQHPESPETDHKRIDVPPERQFVGLDAYKKMLADPDLDVVVLTTPPGFRPLHFEAAVEAGKHVFMEKPVATDSAGVRRVLEAAKRARKKNLKVGVGLNRRHSPMHEELIKRIHDGEIGDVLTYRQYNLRGGLSRQRARVPGESELQHQVRNWYYFTWLAGDFLVEQSVHDYDVSNWLMHEEHPVSCQGIGGRLVRTGPENGNIFDHFYIEYTYADGRRCAAQHRQMYKCLNKFGTEIEGSKGRGSVLSKLNAMIIPKGKTDPSWRTRETGNSYQIEHDRLFKAIREGTEHFEAERGAYATLSAIMGREAAYTGKEVTWEQTLNDPRVLVPDFTSWDDPAPVSPDENGQYAYPLPGVEA